MNKFKAIVITLALAVGLVPLAMAPAASAACNGTPAQCAQTGANQGRTGAENEGNLNAIIRNVVNILLFIIGFVSVIMIIIGGINYTLSQGDSGKVKSAKDTILYAVIGLVVALLAFAIVNFVLSQFAR